MSQINLSDQNKFDYPIVVQYRDVDRHENMTAGALLNYLQEIATLQSDACGATIEFLQQRHLGWFIYNWDVRIDQMPRYNQPITIQTWSCGMNGFRARRDFVITDQSSNRLGCASSLWFLVDTIKHRPMKIPPDLLCMYPQCQQLVFEDAFAPLAAPERPEQSIELKVLRRDIDTNGHVNNTVYVDWCNELVPEQIYQNGRLQRLEVVYKKEMHQGEKVCVHQQQIGPGQFCYSLERGGELVTLVRTAWN